MTTSSGRPPVTAQHVALWAAVADGPVSEKPTSDQLADLRERKAKVRAFKQKITEELNALPGQKGKWSTRGIVCELERKVDESRREDTTPDYQKDNAHPANILDHRPEGGPLLQYLWSPQLQGQTLYLGGEVGSDGHIYCIPGHASQVLQINTLDNTLHLIGPQLQSNFGSAHTSNGRLYKWLRGIVVGDIIYGLPCHADEILKINVKTQEISKLPIPYEEFYGPVAEQHRQTIWKYHGGQISPLDQCIYAIPQAAEHVLKLDPTTETITFVGPRFAGKCKWYGGILGEQDGAIYGIPQNARGVLRITPCSITTHGDYGEGEHKWHGGAAAANGVIVSVPASADTVLCVTPGEDPKLELLSDTSIVEEAGRHRDDGKYKYLGAMASSVNGRVYIFPCASERVLEVDTVHMTAQSVGPNLRDLGMEMVHQNKWQNGLTCQQDGCVYGMPLSAHTLLRVDCKTEPPTVTTWKLPSPRIECRDKFEGGVITGEGVMYTVPNNHKGVLRIEPDNFQKQNVAPVQVSE